VNKRDKKRYWIDEKVIALSPKRLKALLCYVWRRGLT
jgi:hypothetical protein